MTSPMPVMMSEASRSATASIASRRRSTLSVRQSLASSTAERRRFPWCLSSFASNRSKSVKASAVPPAKPARIRSWYRRRTLRALAFTTTLPSVIWPSPPSATFPPRRADTMVVPRNCSMCGPSNEDGAGAPPIKLLARDDARDLAYPHDGEQGVDERVRAAYLDRGAVLVKPGEHLEHEAGGDEIDALRPRHVDDEHGVRRRPVLELPRERFARPGDIPGKGEGLILRLGRTLDRGALRFRARLRIPGRRRNLEGHGVIHRRLLEHVLQLEDPVDLEQQLPQGAVSFGFSHLAGLIEQPQELSFACDHHFPPGAANRGEGLAKEPAAGRVQSLQLGAIHPHRMQLFGDVAQLLQLGRARLRQRAAQRAIPDAPRDERGIGARPGLDPHRRRALEFHRELHCESLELRVHAKMLVEVEQHQPRLQRGGSEVLLAHRAGGAAGGSGTGISAAGGATGAATGASSRRGGAECGPACATSGRASVRGSALGGGV